MRVWKAVKLLLTLHCEESSRLQSEGLERKLSGVERWAVRLHFLSCKACRHFRKQLAFLQEAAERRRELTEGVKLPSETRERIQRELRP